MTSSRTVGNEGETVFPRDLGSFESFCEGLRRDGDIPFGPDHQIRLATLCGRLAVRGVTLRTADEVAWHFAPVIATDARSQAAVQQQIRDVWQGTDAVQESADDATVLSETDKVERALAEGDRGRRKWRRALRIVFGLVCMLLGGLMIYELLASGGPAETNGNRKPIVPDPQSSSMLVVFLQALVGGHLQTLAAIVLLGGAAAIAWMVAISARQGVLRGLAFRSGDGRDLHFEGLGIEFFSAVSGPRSVDALARHRELPARGLDVESSVVRTIRSGGLAHIVPRTVRRLPQYLILSSRESADDHHAGLAEDLHARLVERQVITRRYDFFGSPLGAWEVGKARGSVEVHGFGDLLALTETHGWILIDDTEDLFDPSDRSIYGWVRALAAAAPGVLMTSKPGSARSWREAALENAGIKVVSIMVDDLRDAADFLSGRTTLVDSRHGWPVEHPANRHLKRALEALPADSDEPPSAETQENIIRHLRGYFAFAAHGEATFELFVATCIYPDLKPSLTRMIAAATRDDGDRRRADEVGLGALFALPWFRVGRIPQWLREKAVDSVDAERLARLEQCVHAVLLEPQDRGRLSLKVAGRYPGLIAENLYRLLPRDAAARRDAIFLRSLGLAPEPGVFGVSKAFVRRAVGSSHEALGIWAVVAVTAIGIALYAIFSPGETRFPIFPAIAIAAGYLSATSNALIGAWTNLLLVSAAAVGGTASIVAVGLRQAGADSRTVGLLWYVGACFLVGVAALALVEPLPDSMGAYDVYVAPLFVFAMATLCVTWVLHRGGGERIFDAAWQGIARGRTLAGVVVACSVVLVLAAAGGGFPDLLQPLPGALQPAWAAMGAVLLAASAGRAIGLGRVDLLATGATFIVGYLAGWALAWDMSERFGFSPGGEARYLLAGAAGLMSAAIAFAFHLARHGLDLRAPVVIGALFHVSLISTLYASGFSLVFAFAALPLTIAVGFLVSLGSGLVRAPVTGRIRLADVSRRWKYSLGSFLVVAMNVPVMRYVFDADEATWEEYWFFVLLSTLWVWPVLRGGLQACAGPMEVKPTEMAWDLSGRRWIWLCVPVLWVFLSYTYNWSEWRLALDFLCVPVAIWLGACHGRTGFWVCAVGFFPLLADIQVGDVSSSGWVGGYFVSLLACRYAGISEFRHACFSARRLSRQQIVFLAIGFCFLVSISSGMGASGFAIGNYLGFYVLAVVFLIGTSRIDIAEFIGPVAAVWLLLFAAMLFRSEFHFPSFGPLAFVPAFPGVGYMVSVLGFFVLGRLFRRCIAWPEKGAALVAPLTVACLVVLIFYSFGVAGSYEVGPGATFAFRVDPIGYSLAWALIFTLGVIGGGRGALAAIGVLAAVKVGIPVAVNVLPLSGVLPVAENGWTVPVLDLYGAVTPYWRNFGGTGGLQYHLDFDWRIGVGDFLLALAGWRVHKAIMEARRAGRWKREIEAATRQIQPFGAAELPLLTPNSYFDIAVPVAKVGLVVAVVVLLYNAGLVLNSVAFL